VGGDKGDIAVQKTNLAPLWSLRFNEIGNLVREAAVAVDPRSICNLMLDEAERHRPITNLVLQKLLYFAHGLYLCKTKQPLVSGCFEAWQHGPVNPAAYLAFRAARDRPIAFRAMKTDALTGATAPIASPVEYEVRDFIKRTMVTFGHMSAGQLIDLSHAKNAPWDQVVTKARTNVVFGLRISDILILESFKHHKVSLGTAPEIGEPSEDSPFAADGLSSPDLYDRRGAQTGNRSNQKGRIFKDHL
jgi:uncharacterized phage-associated protein